MTSLGGVQPVSAGAASMAFAEQQLPNFSKQSKAALVRCIKARQHRVVALLLSTPGTVQWLHGQRAQLKSLCVLACESRAHGCLDELFAAGQQGGYGLGGGGASAA